MTSSSSVTLASGHQCFPLGEEDNARLLRDFPTATEGAVRLHPGGWVYLSGFVTVADKIHNFKFRSTDIVTMTYPKSGTTWCQEAIWTMLHDPDLTGKPKSPLMQHAPYVEMEVEQFPAEARHFLLSLFEAMCPGRDPPSVGIPLEMLEVEENPRVIKTHLPLSLLPPDTLDVAKVVYVARNPKDMIVSFYDYCCLIERIQCQSSLESFVEYLVQNEIPLGPYWGHLREAWQKRNHPNLHFVFFEDLKKDTLKEYKKLNEFLGAKLTDEQIERVIDHTSFSKMKSREEAKDQDMSDMSGSSFFRAGRVDNFKGRLTPASEAKIDAWIKENVADFGEDFKYFV